MPRTLSLRFDIDLTGGHANNFLVQNASRALVEKMVVKYAGTILQDTVGYDLYKFWEDVFRSEDERGNMLLEGIQSESLSKIRSGAGDKSTAGVAAENKFETIYKQKYRIWLNHPIITEHGVFYPQALFNDLTFEVTLVPGSKVVRGSDATKLKNIQLEYEMLRSRALADDARRVYIAGK